MDRNAGVVKVLIGLVTGFVLQIIGALVFVQYWQWFIMTTIPDAPDVTHLQALAIALIVGLFMPQTTEEDMYVYILRVIVRLIAAIAVGWLFYLLFFSGIA